MQARGEVLARSRRVALGERDDSHERGRADECDPDPMRSPTPLQRAQQRLHVAMPAIRIAIHAALEHAAQPARRAVGSRGCSRLAAHRRAVTLGEERVLAVDGLPQRDAERELIGRGVERTSAQALGSDVGRGAPDRVRRIGRLDEVGGEAEVGHARAAVGSDEHVVELEVAVGDAGRVGGRESTTCVDEERHDGRQAARRFGEPAARAATVDELHREVRGTADEAGVEHGDHVRMDEPRQRPRLAAQAFELSRRQRGELDRDGALQSNVGRAVDDPHAALAEHALDAVLAVDQHAVREANVDVLDVGSGRDPP